MISAIKNQSYPALITIGRATVLCCLLGLYACASTPKTPPPEPPPPPPPSSPSSPPPQQPTQSSAEQTKDQSGDQAPEQQSQAEQAEAQSEERASQSKTQQSQSSSQQSPEPQQARGADGTSQPQATGSESAAASQSQPGSTAGAPATGGAPTRGERQQQLGGEFERSLGEFDERLAREQGELQTMGDAQASAARQRSKQDGQGSGAGIDDGRASAPLPPPVGAQGDGQTDGPRGPGSPGDRASLPPAPDDVPSGQNDDVVARQLREAAENETDPELREKLWEEYRQYKRNNG